MQSKAVATTHPLGVSQFTFGADCVSCSFVALYQAILFCNSTRVVKDSVRDYLVWACRDWRIYHQSNGYTSYMYPNEIISTALHPECQHIQVCRDKAGEFIDYQGLNCVFEHKMDDVIQEELKAAQIRLSLQDSINVFMNTVYERANEPLGATITCNGHTIFVGAIYRRKHNGETQLSQYLIDSLARNHHTLEPASHTTSGASALLIQVEDDEFKFNAILAKLCPASAHVSFSDDLERLKKRVSSPRGLVKACDEQPDKKIIAQEANFVVTGRKISRTCTYILRWLDTRSLAVPLKYDDSMPWNVYDNPASFFAGVPAECTDFTKSWLEIPESYRNFSGMYSFMAFERK